MVLRPKIQSPTELRIIVIKFCISYFWTAPKNCVGLEQVGKFQESQVSKRWENPNPVVLADPLTPTWEWYSSWRHLLAFLGTLGEFKKKRRIVTFFHVRR